jgi:hypothetical protein
MVENEEESGNSLNTPKPTNTAYLRRSPKPIKKRENLNQETPTTSKQHTHKPTPTPTSYLVMHAKSKRHSRTKTCNQKKENERVIKVPEIAATGAANSQQIHAIESGTLP